MAERSERIERVTLQTIADHVGVSRVTVSNAFSRPDQLSAQLRDRVLEVADQLGYTGPDPTARALVHHERGNSYQVRGGWLTPWPPPGR